MVVFAGSTFLHSVALVLVLALCISSQQVDACAANPPVATYYARENSFVENIPTLNNPSQCNMSVVDGTDGRVFELVLPSPFAFYGNRIDTIYINKAGFVSFSYQSTSDSCPVEYQHDSLQCARPFAGFSTADTSAQSLIGYRGIAVMWAKYSNMSVSCSFDLQNVRIDWDAGDVIDDASGYEGNSLGAANFTLVLSRNQTDYQIYHRQRPSSLSGVQYYLTGPWYYLAPGPTNFAEWCDDLVSHVDYLELSAWNWRAVCGNGIREADEECDLGPVSSSGCFQCICSSGFSCQNNVVTELPRIKSTSSLQVVSWNVGTTPRLDWLLYRRNLPLESQEIELFLDNEAFFPSTFFCEAIGNPPECQVDGVNSIISVAPYYNGPGPYSLTTTVLLPNTSTYLSTAAGLGGISPTLGFVADLGTDALLRAVNTTRATGTTAFGCRYPDLMYYVTYDNTSSSIVVQAIDVVTRQPYSRNYTVPWVPDEYSVPNALVGVNTTSHNVFLFVYAPSTGGSQVYIMTPELTPIDQLNFRPALRPFQRPVSVAYIPDYDAFAFSISGRTGVFYADRAAFYLLWPEKYSSGSGNSSVTRTMVLKESFSLSLEQSFGVLPFIITNNFCCRSQCYNGFCNSTTGQCVCKSGFSGDGCTTFSSNLAVNPERTYVVLQQKKDFSSGDTYSATRCLNLATNTTSLPLYVNGILVNTLLDPFGALPRQAGIAMLPNVALSSASGSLSIRMENLYCTAQTEFFTPSSSLPRSVSNGQGQYAPFNTIVEVVPLRANSSATRSFNGNAVDLIEGLPSDPVIYRISPIRTAPGGTQNITIRSTGSCVVQYVFAPETSNVPGIFFNFYSFQTPVKKRTVVRETVCSTRNQEVLGPVFRCLLNTTIELNQTTWDDLWMLINCGSDVNVTVDYLFIPPSNAGAAPNCSNILPGVATALCNQTSPSDVYVSLTNSTIYGKDLYLPPQTTLNLNGYDLRVKGNLFLGGGVIINTTWIYINNSNTSPPSTTKRRALLMSQNAASLGAIGSITVDGCAQIDNAKVNLLIDASTLPPGSASSQAQNTTVVTNPLVFNCGGGSVSSTSSVTISNENDNCVDHALKSTQTNPSTTGLQVLFTIETTPTGNCVSSANPSTRTLEPQTSAVPGNDVNVGLIAGVVVGAVAAILIVLLIIYLASPAFRAKVNPFRGTQV